MQHWILEQAWVVSIGTAGLAGAKSPSDHATMNESTPGEQDPETAARPWLHGADEGARSPIRPQR
ncbi:MAG TPA: hypothetical protein VIL20_02945 [Sandaracinaceae bacterium]